MNRDSVESSSCGGCGSPKNRCRCSDDSGKSASVMITLVPIVDTPTITIGPTITGPPGSDADVENIGTPLNPVLVFTIPEGEQGEPGEPGPPGEDGTDGTDGTDGIAATITVGTVTTGAPGSLVTFVNVGTPTAAVINVSIPQGATGAPGGSLGVANFNAIMPPDNAATIALGTPVLFPNDGSASPGSGITRLTAGTFNLAAIGQYDIYWQVPIDEAGQLVLVVNGLEDPASVAGRATGASPISNTYVLTTTVPNTVISVNNPAGNSSALTVTPLAGGFSSASAQLRILRVT